MEKILGYIDGIKRSGLSTTEVGYGNWIILFTEEKIRFVKKGTHFTGPVGAVGGALGGYLISKATDMLNRSEHTYVENDEVSKILNNAHSYYEFPVKDLHDLLLERNIFLSSINTIVFIGKHNNKLKIILTKKQYQIFGDYCKNLYSYDIIKEEKKSSFLKSLLELTEK